MTTKTAETATANSTAPEREKPANVVQALARVMEELPGIGKNDQAAAAQGGYAYRGIEAITGAAQHILGRYGVVWVPKVLDRQTVALTVNGKPWTEEQLTVLYTLYGPGGPEDRIEVGPLVALGRDNADKGTNKAMTQAFKYALLQVLCIGDGKDDGDSGSMPADARQDEPPPDPDAWFKANGWRDRAEHDAWRVELGERVPKLSNDQKRAWSDWREEHHVNLSRALEKVTADAILGFLSSLEEPEPPEPEYAPGEDRSK